MYDKFENIKKSVPVITDLGSTLSRKKVRNEGKALSVFMVSMVICGLVYFTQLSLIKSLIPIPTIYTTIIYIGISLSLSAKLSVMLTSDLSQKVKEKTINQGGNSKFSLNKVWRIELGGITESIPIPNSKRRVNTTLNIKYDTNAVIMKLIMGSVIDADVNEDLLHYQSLSSIYDTILTNKFEFELVDMRYNTDNDSYWNYVSSNVKQASIQLGSQYSWIRNRIEASIYEQIKEHSTVDVQYLIIKSTPLSTMTLVTLVNSLILKNKSRLSIDGLSINEFKTFLEQYFEIPIAIEDIEQFTSSNNNPLETKLLSYKLNGELINISKAYTYIIPNELRSYDEELRLSKQLNKKSPTNKQSILTEEQKEELYKINNDTFGGW